MQTTPISNRLHIGIFGCRNVGKSSLLNRLAGQNVAVISSHPGTTTDPVYKSMELIPFGPVVLIDTAGIDDEGDLGELRVSKTMEVIQKTDLAMMVLGRAGWTDWEEFLYRELSKVKTPLAVIINKIDELSPVEIETIKRTIPPVIAGILEVSSLTGQGVEALKEFIIKNAPEKFEQPTIVGDLVNEGDIVVLVVPVDSEAPKGRLILPQVQVLRDLLDHGAVGITVKETGLKKVLTEISHPKLVVTDSQAFKYVAAMVPSDIPLTSFSILFARSKGDLSTLVEGAAEIDRLASGDRVLIAEACSHHTVKDDIAREKLPRWLREYTKADLIIEYANGQDYPGNLADYQLIIHCGGCMLNRQAFLNRIRKAGEKTVPITNFGVAIAKLMGILPRAIEVFNR